MKNWAVCIDTYNRKEPLSLSMLDKDKTLELFYFVRQEEIDKHFYDDFCKSNRTHVISLGYGLHELGLSRQLTLQWCKNNHVQYCFMMDDGIVDVNDSMHQQLSISDVIEEIDRKSVV